MMPWSLLLLPRLRRRRCHTPPGGGWEEEAERRLLLALSPALLLPPLPLLALQLPLVGLLPPWHARLLLVRFLFRRLILVLGVLLVLDDLTLLDRGHTLDHKDAVLRPS